MQQWQVSNCSSDWTGERVAEKKCNIKSLPSPKLSSSSRRQKKCKLFSSSSAERERETLISWLLKQEKKKEKKEAKTEQAEMIEPERIGEELKPGWKLKSIWCSQSCNRSHSGRLHYLTRRWQLKTTGRKLRLKRGQTEASLFLFPFLKSSILQAK